MKHGCMIGMDREMILKELERLMKENRDRNDSGLSSAREKWIYENAKNDAYKEVYDIVLNL